MRHSLHVFRAALVLTAWILQSSAAAAQDSAQPGVRTVNGMQMYYETLGAGAPLVLLHGFFGCGHSWQPLVASLAAHYRLIIPDLRGHGQSTNPSRQFTHRQAARDVLALLDQLGVRKFRAMGISTGGMTLLHMATQQRDRVDAMVLIGATTYFPEPARVVMRRIRTLDSLPPPVSEVLRECAKRGDPQIRELVSLFHGFKDSYNDMSFTEPALQTITARTLIVHGDRDLFFPVAIPVQAYGAIPRSYLWIVPNGSHVPIFEPQGRQFEEVALAFLRGDWESNAAPR